jgi:PilZ domain-containing protein
LEPTKGYPAFELSQRAARFAIQIPMRYRFAGEPHWYDGETENISRSGVLFRTSQPIPRFTPIEMMLALPKEVGGGDDAAVICRGRVVRTEPASADDARPAVAATIAGFRLAHVQGNDPRRI